MFGLAVLFTFVGVFLLCISMTKHHRQLWANRKGGGLYGLRILGYLVLSCALWGFAVEDGAAIAVVTLSGTLAVAIIAVALVMMLLSQHGGAPNRRR